MLTQKQQAILDFIQEYMQEHQYPPSVREIGARFGIYPATVQDHISALERKGFLQKQRFRSRTLAVKSTDPQSSMKRQAGVPVVGQVAAGSPIVAQESIEKTVHLPQEWAPPGSFLLRVRGDSMIGAHILNGDYVLVQPQPTAANGDIVVALLGDEATVKRFYKTQHGITLKAENPDFAPIEIPRQDVAQFKVIGRVSGVLRVSVP